MNMRSPTVQMKKIKTLIIMKCCMVPDFLKVKEDTLNGKTKLKRNRLLKRKEWKKKRILFRISLVKLEQVL